MKNQYELAANKLPNLADDINFSQLISAISNENSLLMGKEQKSLIKGITYLQHLIAEIKKNQLSVVTSNYLFLNSILIIVEFSRLFDLSEKNPNVNNLLNYLSTKLNCNFDKLSTELSKLIKAIDTRQIDGFYIKAAKKIEYALAVSMQALFHKDFELDIFSKLFNQLILLGTSSDDQKRKKAAVEISGMVFSELNRLKALDSAKVSYLYEDLLVNLHEFILKENLDSRYEKLDVSQRKAMFGSWGKLQQIVEEINNGIVNSLLFGNEYKQFAALARRFAEFKSKEKKIDIMTDFSLQSYIEFFWNTAEDNFSSTKKIVQEIKKENNLGEIKLASSLSAEQKILFCEKLIEKINNPRFLPLDSEWAEFPINYYASNIGKFDPYWSSNWFRSKVIVSAGPSRFDEREWDMEHFIKLVISCKPREVLALGKFNTDFWLYIPKELLSENCPKNTDYTMEIQGKNTKFTVSGKKITDDVCQITFKDDKNSSHTFYFSNIRVLDNTPVYLDNMGIAKWHSFCVNTTEQNPSLIHCASGVGRSGQMNEELQLFNNFKDKAIFRLVLLKLLYKGDLSVAEKQWLKDDICQDIMEIRQTRYQIHVDSQGREIFPQELLTVGFDLGIKDEKLNSLREAIYHSLFQASPKNFSPYIFGCPDAAYLGNLLNKAEKPLASEKQETYGFVQQALAMQSDNSKIQSMEKPVVSFTTELKQTFISSETTVGQVNMQQFFEAIKNNNNYKDIEKLLNEKELDLKITHEGKKALYYAAKDLKNFLIFNLLVTKVDVKQWDLSAEELLEIKQAIAKEGSPKMKKTYEALEKKLQDSVLGNTSVESSRSVNELH